MYTIGMEETNTPRFVPDPKLYVHGYGRKIGMKVLASRLGVTSQHLWSICTGRRMPGGKLMLIIEDQLHISARSWYPSLYDYDERGSTPLS